MSNFIVNISTESKYLRIAINFVSLLLETNNSEFCIFSPIKKSFSFKILILSYKLFISSSFSINLSLFFSKNKIGNTKADSIIGEIWVSFFIKEIVTLRDKDWNDLINHFFIPYSVREIDHQKIKLLDKNNIPLELNFY